MVAVDIIGFGPIGRETATRLVNSTKPRFKVSLISDSSATVYTKDRSEVLDIVRWKSNGRKLMEWDAKKGLGIHSGSAVNEIIRCSGSPIVVDVTNSDYSKDKEARSRALAILESGKHLVTASKVALSNHYYEIFSLARKRDLMIGFSATILGARNAVSIVKNIDEGEVFYASAVLNSSTTLILSKLEENPKLTFEQACESASKTGVLESDWSIDLDGIDAAAKTAIFGNVLFPDQKLSIRDVSTQGIRDKRGLALINMARKMSGDQKRVRLVAELNRGKKPRVSPQILSPDSPLAVEGRYNAVFLKTRNFGEISVRNKGGGVRLTASALFSDLKRVCQEI